MAMLISANANSTGAFAIWGVHTDASLRRSHAYSSDTPPWNLKFTRRARYNIIARLDFPHAICCTSRVPAILDSSPIPHDDPVV
jgi:hypothetical protein